MKVVAKQPVLSTGILLTVVLGLVAAACGGADGVTVDKPWARSSPRMANAGAVYMNLSSPNGDRLIGATVDSSIAGKVEIHETAPVEQADGATGDDELPGAMMMQEVGEIELPAGANISLEPGGYHIMLLDIINPLEIGQTFNMTLEFEKAGEMVVGIEVREEAP